MVPTLMERYNVRSLVEIGVCTGLTTVNVVHRFWATLESYYIVDPWGGVKCTPWR